MAITFTIRIKGLALCFVKEPFCHVIFVCDNVHPLDFTYPKGGGTATEALHATGRDLEIEFQTANILSAANPFEQGSGRLFNMAGKYAHGAGKLRLLRRKQITDLVSMRVPTSVIGVSETSDGYYYVQEQTFPGAPVRIIGPVAKDVILTFGTKDMLVMAVGDPKDPSYKKEFRFEDTEANVNLDFDNDCHNKCTHNDFLDLYEVVIDGTEGSERRFAAGQVSGDIPNSQPDVLSRLGGIMSPEQGNCDPVGIIPPPGP